MAQRKSINANDGTRLYGIWRGMLSRCCPTVRNYGKRGISVCEEWKAYPVFKQWALANGYTDTLTIDRINVDGHYEPGNCRWITRGAQSNNRRNSKYLTAFGETKTMIDWSRDPRSIVSYRLLKKRVIEQQWPIEHALMEPVRHAGVGYGGSPCNGCGANYKPLRRGLCMKCYRLLLKDGLPETGRPTYFAVKRSKLSD